VLWQQPPRRHATAAHKRSIRGLQHLPPQRQPLLRQLLLLLLLLLLLWRRLLLQAAL
jgi:hypothetical protein